VPKADTPADVAQLRRAAERCLSILGNGLLQAPANATLRQRVFGGNIEEQQLGRQLQIRLLQVVAWCLGEQLGVVPLDGASSASRADYQSNYSSQNFCEEPLSQGGRDPEALGPKLQRVLRGLWYGDEAIAVASFHSALFDPAGIPDIAEAVLSDAHVIKLVTTIHSDIVLSRHEGAGPQPDVQILGRVHEWLLQLRLLLNRDGGTLTFETAPGHQRRATGSYFTPEDLVENLVELVIEPQIDGRVAGKSGERARSAILSLRIVDPACGTGIFLIAAAKRIAKKLAKYPGESTPGRDTDLAEVISRCIYGVDIGQTTVCLCRLALWFEMGSPYDARPELDAHIRCGNSVFGARPELLEHGIPDIAFTPSATDDARLARALRRRNRLERAERQNNVAELRNPDKLADLWCAAFVWPKTEAEQAPTHASFAALAEDSCDLSLERQRMLRILDNEFHFFHWHLRFPDVFASSPHAGFDVVIGNPPWVAYAGRSTQVIVNGLKNCLIHSYSSFGGFPTTHGAFVELASRILTLGGRLGLILPASVADLAGYAPTRAAHDTRCELSQPLPDYGEGRFPGVTQPCVALVSRRTDAARPSIERGQPWPLERTDLDPTGVALLKRWANGVTLPPELFGERGFQSTPKLRAHVTASAGPEGRFTQPLREGSDIREFQLGESHLYADPTALHRVLRPLPEFAQVALVVRQTARYPIAAKNDGLAFRNSLLAVLSHDIWHWALMLCLLNSSLFRWTHFHRYRDGRQPILPQLKVGHLRSIAAPIREDADARNTLLKLGRKLTTRNQGINETERVLLDQCVARIYDLSPSEHALVTDWHSTRPR
jgi:hypothetical protein